MSDTDTAAAELVVLSYPDELSEWGRDQIESDRYRGYFRRTLGTVSVGEIREEFVDVGCCGDSLDVPFRIERIDGGDRVDSGTEIEFVERDESMAGGWLVQSAAGPEGADPGGSCDPLSKIE
ncbi:Uncharacterized protein AArcCO_0794 [Halalkaliarchaeum sp. AArc-CO]|uniref:hypothetical protein n=1 Tax=unclassified Halalkaliarchaeum TaxID=2678344 RepID=UPI00217CF59D|nr:MULTISPECIES: hypothetical protein [unclassified Halalkaliarchaeum]MDR5672269.1 hypothetical protein [Halalkaliarchaeum sp. AArc-GB]UWG50114.1 Uncharacterized protein AArcCO_0794 [Halalkaliarchaeum sp. AArc-CO]